MSSCELIINADESVGTISPMLHGHFAEHIGRCCYDGLWVGPESTIPNTNGFRSDVLAALAAIGIPLLRWPGGCFADTYHWRDGIGPAEQRTHALAESCGLNVSDTNELGTHEFIALCHELGAEPYLAANVGSGTPRELMDWIDYCNGAVPTTLTRERAANGHPDPMKVKYWGIGNENWGCGGNYEAADYAKEFRRFATFAKQADRTIQAVACGDNNRDWNLRVVETLRNHLSLLDHLSVHRYWGAGHAVDFNEDEYYRAMRGSELIESDIRHADEVLTFFEAGRRKVGIAFDEWGLWHPQAVGGSGYEAASTQRDAVAAAGALDVFHSWCCRVSMANIAQIVNVLQALVQTDGANMWVTPTGYVFQMYAPHRGAEALRTVWHSAPVREMEAVTRSWPESTFAGGTLPLVSASASRTADRLIVSVSNRSLTDTMDFKLVCRGASLGEGEMMQLAPGDARAVNSAASQSNVGLRRSNVAPSGAELRLQLPPCSVQTITLRSAAV